MRDPMPGHGLVKDGTPLRCPACGSDELKTFETLLGAANCTVAIDKNGNRVVDHEGYTEVFWDTSESTGIACASCDWDWEDNVNGGLEKLQGSCCNCGSLTEGASADPSTCESCCAEKRGEPVAEAVDTRRQAEQIIAEDRVPVDVLETLVAQYGGCSPHRPERLAPRLALALRGSAPEDALRISYP